MNASLRCFNCEEPVETPANPKCPVCKQPWASPSSTQLPVLVSLPQAAREPNDTSGGKQAANDAAAGNEEKFAALMSELAGADKETRVIANVGLGGAGKSWLIARMGDLRSGDCFGTFYTEDGTEGLRTLPSGTIVKRRSGEVFQLCNGDVLPRTQTYETYAWHLVPKEKVAGTRSGKWRVVDIAGEFIKRNMIEEIVRGSPLYDLMLMTLSYMSALVVVVDGREIAHPSPSRADTDDKAETGSLDQRNEKLILNLSRLIRFINDWNARHGLPKPPDGLKGLKEAIGKNPTLDLPGDAVRLTLPTLLVMSKADELIRLPRDGQEEPPRNAGSAREKLHEPPGPDPARFAERHLWNMSQAARENIAIFRWAFVAPFVGQPREAEKKSAQPEPLRREANGTGSTGPKPPDPSEIINFDRRSYGIRQALQWLDDELVPNKRSDAMIADHALGRSSRWRPPFFHRKSGS